MDSAVQSVKAPTSALLDILVTQTPRASTWQPDMHVSVMKDSKVMGETVKISMSAKSQEGDMVTIATPTRYV
uniref:Uncharacterized protein n=1 Tax=Arion vulgaris TaxID=1028688 RepID=A0A0B6ZI12_9EUPU